MVKIGNQEKVDPDLFESLIIGINTISTVGSFAIAWYQIRSKRGQNRQELDRFQIKTQISHVEEQFEIAFRNLREIISLFHSVELRENKQLADIKIGFGRATYNFTSSEFQYYQNLMMRLNGAFGSVSASSTGLILLLSVGRVSGENSINNNLEGIHEDLNNILFSSISFDQAIFKIELLRDKVKVFLRQLEYIGNSPD